MAFRVRPDGAIECDTAAEALSLSRQMVGASPAPTAAAKDRPDQFFASGSEFFASGSELREPPSPPDPTAPGSSAWDPPSGTWYFYCQCGAIDMMNQSLDSGTESAVCRYCGVRATRPAIEEVPPAPDETAAIGSPAWWAWFFMQNGRDPTAADMAQATRARSTP